MTLPRTVFALFYAIFLQWDRVPLELGIPLDGDVALFVFVTLWGAAIVLAWAVNLTWRGLIAVFISIFVVDLCVAVASYAFDLRPHSRDVPLMVRPILSLMFASIAASGPLIAVAARARLRI